MKFHNKMKKIILFTACTLDGFIAGENDEIDWLFTDGDYGYKEFLDSVDTTLWGNRTWELAEKMEGFEPYTDKANYVFTRQKKSPIPGKVLFHNGNIPELVHELKNGEGKDIWLVGGGEINTILLNASLIDEMVLSYHPVVLGKGKPLFPNAERLSAFKTMRVQKFESGLVQLILRRKDN
jgi:dihydrofolate reductase